MITEQDIANLKAAWKRTFGREPMVVINPNPIDDAYGPEVYVDGRCSIYAEAGKYRVSVVHVHLNYPHAPDDMDFTDEGEFVSFAAAVACVAEMCANETITDFFTAEAEATALAAEALQERP